MSWYDFIRKYVWSDEKTPYFVPVARLRRRQAESELFVFSVLMAAFFFVTGLLSLLGASDIPGAFAMAAYSFALCSSAIALGATRHRIPAFICATAPPALLGYLLAFGFPRALHMADKLLIGAIALLLGLYCFRVVAIARAYPRLRDGGRAG
jgi:hypothetical protein